VRSVGVRELKQHTSRVLRDVRRHGTEIEVTHHGRTVARLVPVLRRPRRRPQSATVWSTIDRLAREIGARWPKGISAVQAVREGRRDL
jgi:prevent-host-death family protein